MICDVMLCVSIGWLSVSMVIGNRFTIIVPPRSVFVRCSIIFSFVRSMDTTVRNLIFVILPLSLSFITIGIGIPVI